MCVCVKWHINVQLTEALQMVFLVVRVRKLSGFVLWNEKNVVQCTLAVVFCCG